MLTTDNFRFAKQAGATHIVAHLTDYFGDKDSLSTGSGSDTWGITTNQDKLWSYEELSDLRKAVNAEGLELEALENFDPSHWYDILLDGPRRVEQMAGIKTTIRNIGRAGIPIMGYYFSVAGAWGRTEGKAARGKAKSAGFHQEAITETPIPNGTVWNMVYDPNAPEGAINPVTQEQIWRRLEDFLTELVPVAEEVGVKLASHPDDPPLPTLSGTSRLVYKPEQYQKLLDIVPSPNNALEFCVGTIAEMNEGELDVYEALDQYSRQGKIAYVHFRNVVGKVPDYDEVFVDEGDVDMFRVLHILHSNGFEGVLIPDHTPQMSCDAPWHAGMAYALGYLKAAITSIEAG
jgi:mannonate dehydratase